MVTSAAGYLGVGAQVVRLPAALAQEIGQETGLLLGSVEPNSPAERGSLFMGDTIVALDGHAVAYLDDLADLLTATAWARPWPCAIGAAG